MTTLIIILSLLLVLLAATIIVLLVRMPGRKGEEAENIARITDEMQRNHDMQMSALRTSYAEQRAEMKNDFNARLLEIENLNALRIQEMKAGFERQAEKDREAHEQSLEALKKEAAAEYKILAREILEQSSDSLRRQNENHLSAILNPLRENITSFNKLVTESYVKENSSRQSLSEQISRLMDLNRTIGEEARNLTHALKNDSKTQGDWGETLLQTLLEQAGLSEGIHFRTQVTRDERGNILRSEEGKGLRPDVIVNLPDKRKLIIDSKVSLTAFAEYSSTEDAAQKSRLAKSHLESVKRHINELKEASYQSAIADTADHVLMFIPVENAYLLAMQTDRDLWKYAYERHVAIVSPTHLFSVMQIISQLWTQDDRNRNVLKIAEAGGRLYDKFASFCDDFLKIEKSLADTQKAYDSAFKHLVSGRGNLVSRAENMRTLGAKVKKQIPSKIADAADPAGDGDIYGEQSLLSGHEAGSLEKEAE